MNLEDENGQFQSDELNALSAIYGDDFVVEEESGSNRVCYVNLRNPDNPVVEMKFEFRLPTEYPLCPPIFELNCPHMKASDKRNLSSKLQDIYLDNLNQPILFLWIEAVKNQMTDFGCGINQNDDENEEDYGEPIAEVGLFIYYRLFHFIRYTG